MTTYSVEVDIDVQRPEGLLSDFDDAIMCEHARAISLIIINSSSYRILTRIRTT